jgi:AMMECR1 domain-containing protein/orotate phosphoribosyltransferase
MLGGLTMSQNLVALPQTTSPKEELRQLLAREAILHTTAREPIRHRDGSVVPWAFYSWHVTLTSQGIGLAAVNLLERLQSYRSTQIASFGYTAMPLMSACVLLGGGRYTGLCVREARKAYISGRQVEGRPDRTRPVVIVDDSLSSGTSLCKAITALENDGFTVEGAIALVNFPYRGGLEWATANGYRVETLFEMWTDLEKPRPAYVAGHTRINPAADPVARIPDGLHPATVARLVAEHYLATRRMPRPPHTFDAAYDARGGTFVSFREPGTERRLAREGFWHFNPSDADPCRDVVLATVKTLDWAGAAISGANLDRLKIAVSFFGPLEEIQPRLLDFDRYGIVVQSLDWDMKLGGALPNTEVFTSEVEQYAHARDRNADISLGEPHRLFRHEVVKCVEPGATWLAYGTPDGPETRWTIDEYVGKCLTARVRGALLAHLAGEDPPAQPLPANLISEAISGIAVTLYHHGFLAYGIARGESVDECAVAAARAAADDRRFRTAGSAIPIDRIDIAVTVLYAPEPLGYATPGHVVTKVRKGLDALQVTSGQAEVTFLPSSLVYNNWTKQQFVEYAGTAAGAGEPRSWTTYKTSAWLRSGDSVCRLHSGFPVRSPEVYSRVACERDIVLLAGYIMNNRGADGLPDYYQAPVSGELQHTGTSGRVVHSLFALYTAGRVLERQEWRDAALRGLERCLAYVGAGGKPGAMALPGCLNGAMADCGLLAAASCPELVDRPATAALARRVRGLLHPAGWIGEHAPRLDHPQDHDYLPGAALWGLGRYVAATGDRFSEEWLATCMDWYRRRWTVMHPWGMVGWQTQGWREVQQSSPSPHAAWVFELADWAIDRQLEKNGAFLEDLSPTEPSFNTGFLAEGIAAAWALAREANDDERATRYERSWQAAALFCTSLIIYPEDTFCMADPRRAVGGVRTTPSRSDVRIDQVSHLLHALADGWGMLGEDA